MTQYDKFFEIWFDREVMTDEKKGIAPDVTTLIKGHQPQANLLEGIPAAKSEAVEKLYARQTRFILGGLQDHLTGSSLQRYPVKPRVLQLAKEAALIKNLQFSLNQ